MRKRIKQKKRKKKLPSLIYLEKTHHPIKIWKHVAIDFNEGSGGLPMLRINMSKNSG